MKNFNDSWIIVLKKTPVEFLRELAIAIDSYKKQNFPLGPLRNLSPNHIAAKEGKYQLMQYIMTKIEDKNPRAKNGGQTPLHIAAERDDLDICRLIVLNANNKNPADNNGSTPLHHSVSKGNLEIYQSLTRQIDFVSRY